MSRGPWKAETIAKHGGLKTAKHARLHRTKAVPTVKPIVEYNMGKCPSSVEMDRLFDTFGRKSPEYKSALVLFAAYGNLPAPHEVRQHNDNLNDW